MPNGGLIPQVYALFFADIGKQHGAVSLKHENQA
jgi:hypothetical protein